jgi:hypothetical protein
MRACVAQLNNIHDYQVRFLDADGVRIEEVSVFAESLAAATERAGQIANEIGAADFVITLKRETIRDVRGDKRY